MHELNDLITQALERGADGASFLEIAGMVAELEPADQLLVWFKTLSKNPDLVLVRLQLAKVLWRLECAPFALEQLQHIHILIGASSGEALQKLILKLGGSIDPASGVKADNRNVQTLASVDFDIEVLDEDK